MKEHKSEVAAFRERQRLEEESSRLGLYGYAAVSAHEVINAKTERHLLEVERILQSLPTEEARVAFLQSMRCPVNPS